MPTNPSVSFKFPYTLSKFGFIFSKKSFSQLLRSTSYLKIISKIIQDEANTN